MNEISRDRVPPLEQMAVESETDESKQSLEKGSEAGRELAEAEGRVERGFEDAALVGSSIDTVVDQVENLGDGAAMDAEGKSELANIKMELQTALASVEALRSELERLQSSSETGETESQDPESAEDAPTLPMETAEAVPAETVEAAEEPQEAAKETVADMEASFAELSTGLLSELDTYEGAIDDPGVAEIMKSVMDQLEKGEVPSELVFEANLEDALYSGSVSEKDKALVGQMQDALKDNWSKLSETNDALFQAETKRDAGGEVVEEPQEAAKETVADMEASFAELSTGLLSELGTYEGAFQSGNIERVIEDAVAELKRGVVPNGDIFKADLENALSRGSASEQDRALVGQIQEKLMDNLSKLSEVDEAIFQAESNGEAVGEVVQDLREQGETESQDPESAEDAPTLPMETAEAVPAETVEAAEEPQEAAKETVADMEASFAELSTGLLSELDTYEGAIDDPGVAEIMKSVMDQLEKGEVPSELVFEANLEDALYSGSVSEKDKALVGQMQDALKDNWSKLSGVNDALYQAETKRDTAEEAVEAAVEESPKVSVESSSESEILSPDGYETMLQDAVREIRDEGNFYSEDSNDVDVTAEEIESQQEEIEKAVSEIIPSLEAFVQGAELNIRIKSKFEKAIAELKKDPSASAIGRLFNFIAEPRDNYYMPQDSLNEKFAADMVIRKGGAEIAQAQEVVQNFAKQVKKMRGTNKAYQKDWATLLPVKKDLFNKIVDVSKKSSKLGAARRQRSSKILSRKDAA